MSGADRPARWPERVSMSPATVTQAPLVPDAGQPSRTLRPPTAPPAHGPAGAARTRLLLEGPTVGTRVQRLVERDAAGLGDAIRRLRT